MQLSKFKTIGVTSLLTLAIFLSGSSLGVTNVTAKETFANYSSAKYGIKMTYPSNWTKMENAYGVVAIFKSPQEGATDNFLENVNITMQDLTKTPMSLKDYMDASIIQLKKMITKINFISDTKCKLGGAKARKIIYTGVSGTYTLKYMQICAMKKNKAYVVTYTAKADTFNKYLTTVNKEIKSFKFSK